MTSSPPLSRLLSTLGCLALLALACDAARDPLLPGGGAGGSDGQGAGGRTGGTGGVTACTIACPALACVGGYVPGPGPCSCPTCAPGGSGGAGGEGAGGAGGNICPFPPLFCPVSNCASGYQPSPTTCGCPTCVPADRDGGSADAGLAGRTQVAFIKQSRSTNTPEIDVIVYGDGSADRTISASPGIGTGGGPKTFPAGSPEVVALFSDLAAVGDVSAIPTGSCAKSVSFGTVTTINAGGKTSGDLQCLQNPSAAATSLVADCNALL